jgi:putative tricarboxylic transport membrane protein
MERHGSGARRWFTAALAVLLGVTVVSCGPRDEANAAVTCERYPNKEVRLVVPYAAGGGFDTWARLIAPVLQRKLGSDQNFVVENLPGGGGMRAVNTVYSARPDGQTLLFTEPGYIAVNQILDRVPGEFDITGLTYLGQVTADPQVFAVAPDSDLRTVEDLTRRKIKHAAQDISPIETITYHAYGVEADYILHEGTSEVALAVRRGDADVTAVSLSSILEFLKAGELRPLLYIGTEKITPKLMGYEELAGTETAEETGHPELGAVLEQHRLLAGPPGMSDCLRDKIGTALTQTLADPEFVAQAKKADLRIVPAGPREAADSVDRTVETFRRYKATLEAEIAQ